MDRHFQNSIVTEPLQWPHRPRTLAANSPTVTFTVPVSCPCAMTNATFSDCPIHGEIADK